MTSHNTVAPPESHLAISNKRAAEHNSQRSVTSGATDTDDALLLDETLDQQCVDTVEIRKFRSHWLLDQDTHTDLREAEGPQRHTTAQLDSLLVAPGGNRSLLYRVAKRLFDIVGALVLLTLLSPVLMVTWLTLMITTKGRPFFCQERLGFCGRPFPCFKFRTMVLNADQLQTLVENEQDGPIFKNRRDPRITRVGAFLRKTSIDELPQLLNVLLGHMSLVGPRPPIESEVEEYEDWHRQRLSVQPGLTCLWQVSGRSNIGFDEWMRMDIWYIENQSLLLDLSLLVRTPWVVLTCRGAC